MCIVSGVNLVTVGPVMKAVSVNVVLYKFSRNDVLVSVTVGTLTSY